MFLCKKLSASLWVFVAGVGVAGHGQVEGPSTNSMAIDPELDFLVALSGKNMAIVWKKDESS